jgi:ketosteroid isomerase-like protein
MGQPPANSDMLEQEIRQIDREEAAAVLATDLPALEKLWADDFTVNGPNNQILKGKTDALARVQAGVLDYTSFERELEAVLHYGDTAILMGLETVEPKGNAPFAGQTLRRRFTNIWMKRNGRWQLSARQATIISRD